MIFLRRASSWLCLGLMICGLLTACGNGASAQTQATGQTIQVVAAENFYGDLARQIGGNLVSVTSILSDPNVDPHEYQSNVSTAIAVSKADVVIENSGGYDSWMDKLLASTPSSQRVLLKAYDLAPIHLPNNEHVWYSFTNISAIAEALTAQFQKLQPAHSATFEANLQAFKQALLPLTAKLNTIKAKYNGTPVGLTETIYLYQSTQEGLQVLTPFEFEKSIAEGNDPPASTVIQATNQINQHQIKVLIFNSQTVTPITTNLENLARAQHIPLVQVSETMPASKTYQSWMMAQLDALQVALGG